MYIVSGFRQDFLAALASLGDSPSRGYYINSCYSHCQSGTQETWLRNDAPLLDNTVWVSLFACVCYSFCPRAKWLLIFKKKYSQVRSCVHGELTSLDAKFKTRLKTSNVLTFFGMKYRIFCQGINSTKSLNWCLKLQNMLYALTRSLTQKHFGLEVWMQHGLYSYLAMNIPL